MPDRYSPEPIVMARADSPQAVIGYQWYAGFTQTLHGETVHEPDNTPLPTGLLDALGRRLVRYPQRNPIGFDLTPRT